jgi:hypothetical protein
MGWNLKAGVLCLGSFTNPSRRARTALFDDLAMHEKYLFLLCYIDLSFHRHDFQKQAFSIR